LFVLVFFFLLEESELCVVVSGIVFVWWGF